MKKSISLTADQVRWLIEELDFDEPQALRPGWLLDHGIPKEFVRPLVEVCETAPDLIMGFDEEFFCGIETVALLLAIADDLGLTDTEYGTPTYLLKEVILAHLDSVSPVLV